MKTEIIYFETPEMNNPVLIEGLPGVGNVGRVTIAYLIEKLNAKKFAELYTPYFFPLVIVNSNSEIQPLKIEFYYYKGEKDLIFMIGDSQPVEYEGYYKVCEKILDLCDKFGVKEIITVGGFGIGIEKEKPMVLGALTDLSELEKYKKLGVHFEEENPIGSIFGISGLLLGLAKKRGLKGCSMLGETIGYPIITDPKAAEEVIKVLMNLFNLKVDLKDLVKNIKQLEAFLKSIEEKTKQLTQQLQQKPKNYTDYIG
ncbi:MAG TPA: proteasome assembly chaperone family protein [Candidatus Aenigmarchaeota archaeon]|nr:proteasome assembly chaperone family protein [Candidatus Aenigmarchaeota archaeon]